jgi:prophage antirepressor-like protein
MQNQPAVFTFTTQSVRVVMIDEAPWFVAADVCDALGLDNNRQAVTRLDDDEKGVISNDTPSGTQEMTIINESGLYSLILGSRKPEAKKFKKWVTSEVLPAIRKTGRYEAPQAVEVAVETINPAQYQALARKVWLIGNAFHMADSAQWWAWKSIRALSGVGAKELPASLYPDAIQILDYQEKSSMAFKSRVIEAEELFMRGRLKNLSDDFSYMLAEERQKVLMSIAN